MVSTKQIAAELNVSRSLVSKVLSGRLGTTVVSQKKRELILAKAKELNFIPNRLAVALKAGSSGSVAVFLHEFGIRGSEITTDVLRGIVEALKQNNRHLWLCFFETQEEFLQACDAKLRNEVDGVIVMGIGHPELMPKLQELENNSVPVVCGFDKTHSRSDVPWTNVAIDTVMQGYLPTKHLIDQGAKCLACLATMETRTEGFLKACREAEIPLSSTVLIDCDNYEIEAGVLAAKRLIRSGEKVEGIVCQSDAQATGVIHELHRSGLNVPKDIMVTGVDDSPLAKSCLVPLTSVSSEMKAVGFKTVELLMDKIHGGSPASVTIPPRLVVRASTLHP